MDEFICPVEGCETELRRLQVMHFRYKHGSDPVEWVKEQYGPELQRKYTDGPGCYVLADEYEWLSPDMVREVVDTQSQPESVRGESNPMKRDRVVTKFTGERNPAKRPSVREKISNALAGYTHSEETKQKISEKNTGNEISERHRDAISEAAQKMDRSYMQTQAYSQALSESLEGREPTYPNPYDVADLSHKVRSSWEEDVARRLVQNDIDYRYEMEFSLPSGSYYPDFVMENHVVEVKGFSNKRAVTKAVAFMKEFPSYTYVVIGDEIPCDIHISWENRETIIEVLNDD